MFTTENNTCQSENKSTPLLRILKISVLLMFILGSSCNEQRRMIIPFVPEGNRVILLEEFTGKGCTNCPKGSREIDNLLAQFPNNLVVVSLHAGFFANPQFFPLGQYDLRTDEGEFIFDYLGPNLGYPAGVVNRIPVNGEMQISLNQWASAITRELQIEPAVELTLNSIYNANTRELMVTVSGIGKQTVQGDIRLSIMLTESGIVDAQDDFEAGGIVVISTISTRTTPPLRLRTCSARRISRSMSGRAISAARSPGTSGETMTGSSSASCRSSIMPISAVGSWKPAAPTRPTTNTGPTA
jgi:hypothetical protein